MKGVIAYFPYGYHMSSSFQKSVFMKTNQQYFKLYDVRNSPFCYDMS